MPIDDQVLMHRLASLIEGMWQSPQIEQNLREADIDPQEFRDACALRLAQIVNSVKPS